MGWQSTVGSDDSAAKGADNGPPRPPIKRDVTESGGGLHVGDAGPAAAPGTKSGGRFAPPHLTGLIDEKTKANHEELWEYWSYRERERESLEFGVWSIWLALKVEPLYKDFEPHPLAMVNKMVVPKKYV